MMIQTETRTGAYHDSIQLMRLHAALEELPGVEEVSAVMATPANRSLLESRGLLSDKARQAGPDDLVIVVRAQNAESARNALAQVDSLLQRRAGPGDDEYRPRSLSAARRQAPEADWLSISVPGRHAAALAREGLQMGLNVFLYSDNVSLKDEAELKHQAREQGLLVLGPDCGTAMLGGFGFGFANRVRRGGIGLVAASGTGLQAVSCAVHNAGEGVSQAIGTGGRDLGEAIDGVTAQQSIDLLRRDPDTRVIVLISKPPHPSVSAPLLSALQTAGKPSVVHFIGQPATLRRWGRVRFASSLSEAAGLAVALHRQEGEEAATKDLRPKPQGRFLRALFSGGTLAWEALYGLQPFLWPLHSNLQAPGVQPLDDPFRSQGHTLIDLGSDEFTVGRLHPMMDPALLIERLRREAQDPETGLLLLDVVLGEGAHPDPASLLAPVIAEATGRGVPVAVLLIGTDEDPQEPAFQQERLVEAGAVVLRDPREAVREVLERLEESAPELPPVPLRALQPSVAINAGVESFAQSLTRQGLKTVQMDWRPPAGGDEALAALLEKMRK